MYAFVVAGFGKAIMNMIKFVLIKLSMNAWKR